MHLSSLPAMSVRKSLPHVKNVHARLCQQLNSLEDCFSGWTSAPEMSQMSEYWHGTAKRLIRTRFVLIFVFSRFIISSSSSSSFNWRLTGVPGPILIQSGSNCHEICRRHWRELSNIVPKVRTHSETPRNIHSTVLHLGLGTGVGWEWGWGLGMSAVCQFPLTSGNFR